jgi:hypothetical protein
MITAAAGALSPPQKRGNPDDFHTAKASISKNYTANNSKMTAKNQQFSFSELHVLMRGKWAGYHSSVGIIQYPANKQVSCQGCGGTDRHVRGKDYPETGRWFCRQGGDPTGGDGFALLGHVFGWTPQQQLQSVADYLGLSSMDNKERDKIRAIAEKQSAQMALDATRKHEQARRDYNIKTISEDLIDAIKHREYLQRQTNKVDGRYVLRPSIDEIALVKELITHSVESYAEFLKPEANHA